MIRCKENANIVLSGEIEKKQIKILLWNTKTLSTLVVLKINRKHFTDIRLLDSNHILLLSRYQCRLILSVFLLIYQKNHVRLINVYNRFLEKVPLPVYKSTGEIKSLFKFWKNDNYPIDLENNLEKKQSEEIEKLENKDEKLIRKVRARKTTRIKIPWNPFSEISTYENGRDIEKKEMKTNKRCIHKKEYLKKMKEESLKGIKIKKYKNKKHLLCMIRFMKSTHNNNLFAQRELKRFRLFIDIHNTIYVYDNTYVRVYFFKNNELFEQWNHNQMKYTGSDVDSSYCRIKKGSHFFSMVHMHIFAKNIFLSRYEKHVMNELSRERKEMNSGFYSDIPVVEKNLEKEDLIEWDEISKVENKSPHSDSVHFVYIKNHIEEYLSNIYEDKINVIETVSFVFMKEGDDLESLYLLTDSHEKNSNRKEKVIEPNINKKYCLIGTKNGIIVITSFDALQNIILVEKICSATIISFFLFKQDILILNHLGELYFMNTDHFKIYKKVNIVEWKINETNRKGIINYLEILQKNPLHSSVKISKRPIITNIKESKEDSTVNHKSTEVNKTMPPLEQKIKQKIKNCSTYVQTSFMMDIYLLLIATNKNELIMYDLIRNESCYLFKPRLKINYFTYINDHIIYNTGNVLHKMNLVNYNSYPIFTLPKVNVSSFVFYSNEILIVGTMRGSILFFTITSKATMTNKFEKKSYLYSDVFTKNSQKKMESQILFSITSRIQKHHRNSDVLHKETCVDKITDLILSKSKKFLISSFKNRILLFKLHVSNIHKVELHCIRCIDLPNIVKIGLIPNYDNLFYVTSKENNYYKHVLCSFSSNNGISKKMEFFYSKVLQNITWIFDFFYYNGEPVIMIENKEPEPNTCIMLSNEITFLFYSYHIHKKSEGTTNATLNEPDGSIERTSHHVVQLHEPKKCSDENDRKEQKKPYEHRNNMKRKSNEILKKKGETSPEVNLTLETTNIRKSERNEITTEEKRTDAKESTWNLQKEKVDCGTNEEQLNDKKQRWKYEIKLKRSTEIKETKESKMKDDDTTNIMKNRRKTEVYEKRKTRYVKNSKDFTTHEKENMKAIKDINEKKYIVHKTSNQVVLKKVDKKESKNAMHKLDLKNVRNPNEKNTKTDSQGNRNVILNSKEIHINKESVCKGKIQDAIKENINEESNILKKKVQAKGEKRSSVIRSLLLKNIIQKRLLKQTNVKTIGDGQIMNTKETEGNMETERKKDKEPVQRCIPQINQSRKSNHEFFRIQDQERCYQAFICEESRKTEKGGNGVLQTIDSLEKALANYQNAKEPQACNHLTEYLNNYFIGNERIEKTVEEKNEMVLINKNILLKKDQRRTTGVSHDVHPNYLSRNGFIKKQLPIESQQKLSQQRGTLMKIYRDQYKKEIQYTNTQYQEKGTCLINKDVMLRKI